jgi:signal transduction histidine kinase/ligand-binding sensor domain-containing protein
MKVLVLAFLSVLPAVALDPQTKLTDLVHTKWSGEDTPFSDVRDLAQTQDGTLWVGTSAGLFGFDGVRFTRIEALSRTIITRLYAMRDGSLWVVFYSGLVSRMLNGQIQTFSPEELPRTNALAQARDGSIVAATEDAGLYRFRNEHWQEAPNTLLHSARRYLNVWFDRNDVLWLTTEDRLLRLLPGEARFKDPQIPWSRSPGPQRGAFAQSSDGTVWLGDGNATRSIDPPAPTTVLRFASETLLGDRQGSLWIGTSANGVWRIPQPASVVGESIAHAESAVEQITAKDGLSGNAIARIFEDREGDIWIGTTRGLDRFRNSSFHRVAAPDEDQIVALWRSNDGGVLLMVNGKPYMYRAAPGGIITKIPLPLPAEHACQDSDGTIWVATAAGFGRLNGKGLSYPPQPRLNAINWLDCRYGDLWISDKLRGVFRFSGGKSASVPEIPALDFTFFLEAPGRAWVRYRDVIKMYDNGSIREYGPKSGVPNVIIGFSKAADGTIWLAYEGGLARFRDNHFQPVNVIPNALLERFDPGNGTSLWVTARNRITKIDFRELDRAVLNPEYRPQLESYGALDGITGGVKLWSGSDKFLWLFTSEGLGYIDVDALGSKNTLPPPVKIEAVNADGKLLTALQGMTLPKLTHSLQIDYTAFSLTVPERVHFRYMLEGVDKNWEEETTLRRAFYTDPAPGKHRFRVKASNNDGVWNDMGATLDFSVEAAFYQTIWFRTLLAGFFLTILWGLYRLRLYQLAREYSAQAGERARIARDLHDTLLQNFHASLIQMQTARNIFPRRPEEAIQTLDNAIIGAEHAIDEGRTTIQNLRATTAPQTNLEYLLTVAGKELSNGPASNGAHPVFAVAVQGACRTLTSVVHDEVYRIGCEVLRNAFRHAHASDIEAGVCYERRNLRLRIRDNGIGIDQKVLEEGAKAGHWGLPGARERAKRIGGRLDIRSDVGTGTEIELTVPASRAYAKPQDGQRFRLFRKRRTTQ